LPHNNKDFVAISIKDSSLSYPPNSKLFCNLCSRNLILLDPQKEEWYCSRCNISYYPNKGEKVKRANKIITPGPDTDIHGNIIGEKMPLVSMVKDNTELSSTYRNPKLPRSFEEMQRHGLKITSYTTTEEG
jgi:ribosomal protein S27AE